MATGVITAFCQGNSQQANNADQYQRLMQAHQKGAQRGAKISSAPARPVQSAVIPLPKTIYTSAALQKTTTKSSVKPVAGKPISQRDWNAAKLAANNKRALSPPLSLSTSRLPAEQVAAMKQAHQKGAQPGARITTTALETKSAQQK